ncbi:MAG: hypothetical protein ACREEM_05435 [Blastocatellia bacterium]
MTTGMIQEGTVDIKHCHACGSDGYEHDRFCRRCGARRSGLPAPRSGGVETTASLAATSEVRPSLSYVTGTLAREILYHKVSGPLVKSVTASLSANTRASLESKLVRRVVLAVISIPIWLIIVLLSPIDAYVVARAAVGQRSQIIR